MSEDRRAEIEQSIAQQRQAAAALEAQRAVLGDATVMAALTSIHRRLATLEQELSQLGFPPERVGADERKQMTILQADVVGSTALASAMDPEEWKSIMNEAHRLIREAVVLHGGTISSIVGDGVVALFGVRQTHEDEPHRALRAALALQRAIRDFAIRLRDQRGIEFAMRVGVASGLVVVGQLDDHGLTAIGDPVTLVNVLEQNCRPGMVLCDLATARAVGPQFELRARVSEALIDDDGHAWEVLRERPRQPHGGRRPRPIMGVVTPTVGRERELTALRAAWKMVLDRGQPWALTIIGEAGLGKSRLVDEVHAMVNIDPRPLWLMTAAGLSTTAGVPFWLLRDLLATRAGLADDAPREEAECAIEATITECWPAAEGGAEAAHVLGYLAGFGFSGHPDVIALTDDPRYLRSRAFYLSEQWLRRLAQQHPIILLIEDMHWADAASLDWLAHIVSSLEDVPLLTGMTARRLFQNHRADWLTDLRHHRCLFLQPIVHMAVRQLGEAILQRVVDLPPWLIDRLVARVEGNPFYLEEIIKSLIEQNAIRAVNDVWRVVSVADVERALDTMPSGLQGLLQTRLDALPADEKALVQRAAVIGRTFWADAVTHLGTENALPLLQRLVAREMIFPQDSSVLVGEQAFQFTHALLRDVAYEMLPRRTRRLYHAAAAEWLEQRSQGQEAERFAAMLADHYDYAGNEARARDWYIVAADAAARTYANDLARHYYSRALDLTPDTEQETRFALLMGRQAIYAQVGDLDAEDRDLTEMISLATAMGEPVPLAAAYALKAVWCWRSGYASQGITASIEGRRLLDGRSSSGLLSRLLRAEGVCHYQLGAYDVAFQVTETALRVAHEIGSAQDECYSLNNLGMIAHEIKDGAEAMAFYQQALLIADRTNSWSLQAITLANLATVYERLGDYEGALHFYQRSLDVDRRLGSRRGEAATIHNIGMLHWILGDDRQAMRHIEQSLAIYRSLNYRFGEALVLADIALMLTRRSEHWEALVYAEQANEILQSSDQTREIPRVLLIQAENLLALARVDEATVVARNAGTLLASIGSPQEAWALSICALAALSRSNLAEADRSSELAVSMGLVEIFRGVGPQNVWWIRYQVLNTLGRQTEAREALDMAHDQVLQQGVHIKSQALRRTFINNVPVHRQIMDTWKASLAESSATHGVQPAVA